MAGCWIFLFRHGETYWNADKRLQGQLDAPLSKVGRQQAVVTGSWLAKHRISGRHEGPTPPNTPPTAVYASDLQRARMTAEAIAGPLGLPVHVDPRLRETNLGVFEGHTWEEVRAHEVLREVEEKYHSSDDYCIPGGESVLDRSRRIAASLNDLATRHAGEKIVVVSHGGVIANVHELLTGRPVGSHISNCSCSIINVVPGAGFLGLREGPRPAPDAQSIYAWNLSEHLRAHGPGLRALAHGAPSGGHGGSGGARGASAPDVHEELAHFFAAQYEVGPEAPLRPVPIVLRSLFLSRPAWLHAQRDAVTGMHCIHLRSGGDSLPPTAVATCASHLEVVCGPELTSTSLEHTEEARTLLDRCVEAAWTVLSSSSHSPVLLVCDTAVVAGPAVAVAIVRKLHPTWSLPRALFYVRARWLPSYPSLPLLTALMSHPEASQLREPFLALHADGGGTAAAVDADLGDAPAAGVEGDEGLR